MWKEAREIFRRGDESSLTAEQKLICHCTDAKVGFNLYYGQVLVEQKRFMESVQLLENAFTEMSKDILTKGKDAREDFFKVCYLLGFSYTELGLYKQANYYLEMLLPLHRISFTKVYVNCLVNSHDFRAMEFIDGLLLLLDRTNNGEEGVEMGEELYGIYQAKKTIAKEDRVYMVEGYTDVISMHQCGIENVVANSGTALSVHQIHTLHRFTSNITLLYDGDAAGIHAALRGTDMLLAEGMNLKVLLLPEGEDPDSFARKHTAIDFRKYIEENQTDFIQFKTDLLLKNQRDPLKRSEAINSIVQSIAVVQNQILRDTYLHDCAQRIGINEGTLINQMNRYIREKKEGRSSDTGVRREEIVSTPKINLQNSSVSSGGVSSIEKMLIQMIMYGSN